MDVDFEKNRNKSSENFVYDKQQDFNAIEDCDWDED